MRRVFIGNDNGAFRFRASMPGHDALTAPDENLTIKEGMSPLTPKDVVTLSVAAYGTDAAGLPNNYTNVPFVVLKAGDNTLPGSETFYARFDFGSNSIKVYNRLGRTLTVKCFIFDEVIF